MVEFQLEDVFLAIFILNMDRKPNGVELFILGPSKARMALSRMAKQRMVGSGTTTTTPPHRFVHGDLYGDAREFRAETVAIAMNDVGCTDVTVRTRTFSRCARLRTPDVVARLVQGFDDMFVCFKNHSIIAHVSVECSFDPVFPIFSRIASLTQPAASPAPLTGTR